MAGTRAKGIGLFVLAMLMLLSLTAPGAQAAYGFPGFAPMPEEDLTPTVLSRYQNQSFTKTLNEPGLLMKFSYVEGFSGFVIQNEAGEDVTPDAEGYSRSSDGALFLLLPGYLSALPEGQYTMTASYRQGELSARFYVFDQPSALLSQQPVTVYANSGDNIRFYADVAVSGKNATGEELGIQYQWYRLSRSGKKKVRGGVSPILQMNGVVDELTGYTYWCEITVPGCSEPFVTDQVKLYIIGAGDAAKPALWAAGVLLSFLGLAAGVAYNKRRSRRIESAD